MKPEVTAPGVELVTADIGRNEDQSARYATISGSSAAAALAAGTAAVLAQARPALDARALKGVLVGTAAPARRRARERSGSRRRSTPRAQSRPRLRRARPPSPSAQPIRRAGSRVRRLTVANVSTRRLRLSVQADPEGIRGIAVTAFPRELRLRPGTAGAADAEGAGRVPAAPARSGLRLCAPARARRWLDRDSVGGRAACTPRRRSSPRFASRPAASVRPTGARRAEPSGRQRANERRPDAAAAARLGSTSSSGAPAAASGCSPGFATCCPATTRSASRAAAPHGRPLARGDYRLRIVAVPPDGAARVRDGRLHAPVTRVLDFRPPSGMSCPSEREAR